MAIMMPVMMMVREEEVLAGTREIVVRGHMARQIAAARLADPERLPVGPIATSLWAS